MAKAFIGIGANLGDKKKSISSALNFIAQELEVKKVSSLYFTKAVGGPAGQPDFINLVVEVETDKSAQEMMTLLLEIERKMGRVRVERWGPRLIDLDLLDYAGVVLREENLELPHPRLHERAFVLVPLMEIAPQWRHPGVGKTAAELFKVLSETDKNVIIAVEKFK